MKRFFLAVLIATAASAAHAAPSIIAGAGTMTCATINEKGDDAWALATSWIQGYMSGANVSLKDTKSIYVDLLPDDRPFQSQYSSIRTFCANHPDVSVVEVAIALYQVLRNKHSIPVN